MESDPSAKLSSFDDKAFQRVASDHLQTWVTNNDGYTPMFLNAPPATSPTQQYWNFNQPGNINARALTTAGRRYLAEVRNRGMLVDIEHLGERTRADVIADAMGSACSAPYSDDCYARAYPLVATHSDLREYAHAWNQVTERTLMTSEVKQLVRMGGVVGLGTGYEHHLPAAPLREAATGFLFNDCPGSSKSFAHKYLGYVGMGEDAAPSTSYFTQSGTAFSSHSAKRPPHWAAGGVSLGSDMNGFAIQIGPRFNPNPGTSCYGVEDFKFDTDFDPEQTTLANEQKKQANAVFYGGAASSNDSRSVSPPNGIPSQPALTKLFFDPSLKFDVYVEMPVDTGQVTQPIQMRGFDFNQIGMANIGLEPDMLQDVVNGQRVTDIPTFMDMRYQMRYLMRGAEDFIAAWEKAVGWCQRSGSSTCGSANLPTYDPVSCDVWASDVDAAPTITDATPSCMARCGQTLAWNDALGAHSCRCFITASDTHPQDLCGDFKPWCQWFYNGADDPSGGRVRRSTP